MRLIAAPRIRDQKLLAGPEGQDLARRDHGFTGQEFLRDPAGEAWPRSGEETWIGGSFPPTAARRARRRAKQPSLGATRSSGLLRDQRQPFPRSRPTSTANLPSRLLHAGCPRQPDPRRPARGRRRRRALLEASGIRSRPHPEEAAAPYAPYGPQAAKPAEIAALLRSHTHGHHPVAPILRKSWRSTRRS